MERCPSYTDIDASYLDAVGYDGPPSCCGEVVGGSGGHRQHVPCSVAATWWHPDDSFAYCDSHVLPRDIVEYLKLWRQTHG